MRIAYVVPYVPSPIRTRAYNLISYLGQLGHEVYVFTLGSNSEDLQNAQVLRAKCKAVYYEDHPIWRSLLDSVFAVPSQRPLQSVYSWNAKIAGNFSQEISRKRCDIIHVEHLRGSRYAEYLKSEFPNTPVIWDSVDCITHLFRQAMHHSTSFFGKFMTRFELARTESAEGKLISEFNGVLVTSDADRDALLKLVEPGRQKPRMSVLPNGVDLEYFYPNPNVKPESGNIVFSGKMSYHANVSMAQYLVHEIMPLVWNEFPSAHLYIVGKDPPQAIRKLGQNPRIIVTGTVEDIRPYLWRAKVAVVPMLYGAGIQNKVLEAMAVGTPVVTTPRAFSALNAERGNDILVANDPSPFSRLVIQMLEDQDQRQTISDAGTTYVRLHHQWSKIAYDLVKIYEQCLRN